jgi:hypothetical protein
MLVDYLNILMSILQLPPTLLVSPNQVKNILCLLGKKFILKLHYNDIEWIKPTKPVEVPVEKETWKFESSSEPGHFYTVKQSGLKLTCNCSGFFRCRDKNIGCKHCQEVRSRILKS